KEMVFHTSPATIRTEVERNKPTGVTLAGLGALVLEESSSRVRARTGITLSDPGEGVGGTGRADAGASSVRLYDEGNGIFSIQMAASVSNHPPAKEAMTLLLKALDMVQQEASIKGLMLRALERCSLRGGREDYNQGVAQGLYQARGTVPCPVSAGLGEV